MGSMGKTADFISIADTGDQAKRRKNINAEYRPVRKEIFCPYGLLVFETLQQTGWNKAQASRLLGVTYKTLLKKVSEYGIRRA